ncbi:MAG: response regulator [Planktomarina sp.]
MTDMDNFLYAQTPTAMRPLLGLTVLLVEDSLTACEAIRLMCLRSGARLRRADCLESARRHLRVYRPTVVITDMGLPDGSGAELINELKSDQTPVDVILGLSADIDTKTEAMNAGATGFIEKPINSLAAFQSAILNYLPQDRHPSGPRKLNTEVIAPDGVALQEDLAHALNLLEDGDDTPATHKYLKTFLTGVAQTASDDELESVTTAYANARAQNVAQHEQARLSAVLIERLAQRQAI